MKLNYWTKKEINFLKQNYKTKPSKDIAKILKRKPRDVIWKASKLGLKKENYFWTKEEIEYLKMNYSKISVLGISKKINRSINSIYLKAWSLKLKSDNYGRRYYADFNIFDKIDTEEKAYWLGFLLADGTINKTTGSLELGLQWGDINHLRKFKKFMKASNPIKKYPNAKTDYKVVINIASQKLKNSLAQYHMDKKKAFRMSHPPNIDKSLVRHFIRGIFDADGSIQFYPTNRRDVVNFGIFCPYKPILEYIKEKILGELGIKLFLRKYQEQWRINCHKKKDIQKLYHYLYKGTIIYLDRKKDIFDSINFTYRRIPKS